MGWYIQECNAGSFSSDSPANRGCKVVPACQLAAMTGVIELWQKMFEVRASEDTMTDTVCAWRVEIMIMCVFV